MAPSYLKFRLNDTCNIRFLHEIFDTEYSEAVTVGRVIQLISRKPEKEQLPCAFIGARRSAVTLPTSMITSIKGYPQFSPASTSKKLDDTSQLPLFGRFIPSDEGTALTVIMYFKKLNVKHLAVLYVSDDYGIAYVPVCKEWLVSMPKI